MNLTWRKSSRSGNDTNCVEVAGSLDRVRDSKNPAQQLHVDVTALIHDLRTGRLG